MPHLPYCRLVSLKYRKQMLNTLNRVLIVRDVYDRCTRKLMCSWFNSTLSSMQKLYIAIIKPVFWSLYVRNRQNSVNMILYRFEIMIYTSLYSWINKLSIDVWLVMIGQYLKIWNLRMQKNINIEKIIFKFVQMKFLAMHITNQKLGFNIFTVGNLLNIFMILIS